MSGLWDWVNDNGMGLNAVAVLVTAAVAVVALSRTAKDSRERTRPYVIVEYQRIPYVSGALALVVRNAGQTVASDVHVTFDALGPGAEYGGSLVDFVARRYQRVFSAMAPGQSFANNVFIDADDPPEDKMPDVATAIVTYRYGRRRHSETFVLDSTVYNEEVSLLSPTASPEGRLKSIGDVLKNLASEVAKIEQTLSGSSAEK